MCPPGSTKAWQCTAKAGWTLLLNLNSTRPSAVTNCSPSVPLAAASQKYPARAYLSYSQSYSIVKFLIESYGQDKMNSLLIALRDGTTIDDALVKVYGFDIEGLEDTWRNSIGAAPQPASVQPNRSTYPNLRPDLRSLRWSTAGCHSNTLRCSNFIQRTTARRIQRPADYIDSHTCYRLLCSVPALRCAGIRDLSFS